MQVLMLRLQKVHYSGLCAPIHACFRRSGAAGEGDETAVGIKAEQLAVHGGEGCRVQRVLVQPDAEQAVVHVQPPLARGIFHRNIILSAQRARGGVGVLLRAERLADRFREAALPHADVRAGLVKQAVADEDDALCAPLLDAAAGRFAYRVCACCVHSDAVDAVFLEENRLAEVARRAGERVVGADRRAPAVRAQAEVLAPVFEVAEGTAVDFVEVLRAFVAVAAAPEAVAALADVVHVGHAAGDAEGDALVVRARGADARQDEVVALRGAAGRAAEGVDDFFAVQLVERQAGDAHAVVLREERRDAALTRQSDAGAGRGDLGPSVERGAVLAQDRGRAAAGVEPEGVVFGVFGGGVGGGRLGGI